MKLYVPSWFRVMVPIAPVWAPTPGVFHIGWICLVLGETKVSGIVVGTDRYHSCGIRLGIKSQTDHIIEATGGWTEEGHASFTRLSSRYLEFACLLSFHRSRRKEPSSGTDKGRTA